MDMRQQIHNGWELYINTRTLEELLVLRDEMRDVVIEYVAFLRKHGMKTKLKRTWAELISE